MTHLKFVALTCQLVTLISDPTISRDFNTFLKDFNFLCRKKMIGVCLRNIEFTGDSGIGPLFSALDSLFAVRVTFDLVIVPSGEIFQRLSCFPMAETVEALE